MRQETSDEAFDSVKDAIPELAKEVLDYLVNAGPVGMTDEEIYNRMNAIRPTVYSTERSARLYLVDKLKVVIDSGRRRPSSSNRRMIVWIRNTPKNVMQKVIVELKETNGTRNRTPRSVASSRGAEPTSSVPESV